MPSEYELVSTDLHYYTRSGFEVRVPLSAWYEEHVAGSRLTGADWGAFRDPRETTYAAYARRQREREAFVDGVLRSIDERGYDARLDPAWVAALDRVLAPSRFLFHGLQMAAAYVGQIAPAGRITIACAFQAGDEMRRVQRVAYRMAQLGQTHPGFGEGSRPAWQSDPAWQPLREAIERLLVAYDWGEALVALCLVIKPALDAFFIEGLAAAAVRAGDPLFAEVLYSLGEDCAWHREWSLALLRLAVDARPENRRAMQAFVDKWHPLARRGVEALAPALPSAAAPATDPCAAGISALGLGLPIADHNEAQGGASVDRNEAQGRADDGAAPGGVTP